MDTTIHDTLQLNSSEYLNYIEIPFNLVVKMRLGKKVKFVLGGGTYLAFFYNGQLKVKRFPNKEYSVLTTSMILP